MKSMNIRMILLIIFLPAVVMLAFSLIKKSGDKVSNKMSDKNFTVMLSDMVLWVGVFACLTASVVLLVFSFFSEELPHWIFYVTFGGFFWSGMYLILKTLNFKVIVKGENITVFSTFRKPYSFTFNEIVSAVRQVKKNQVKSERIVIRTVDGRKLIVESVEISYERFAKRIQAEVRSEYLVGFE